MENIFAQLFLQFLPETLVLTFLTIIFLKTDLDIKKLLIISILNTITSFFYRLLPLTFGFHTILSIITLTFFVCYFFKVKLLTVFFAILKTFIIFGVVELISFNLFLLLTGNTTETVLNNQTLKTTAILLQSLILLLIGLLLYRKRMTEQKVKA